MTKRKEVVDGLEAFFYLEDLKREEEERLWRAENQKLIDEPAAGHVHEWYRRRDGLACECGAYRFGVVLP